MSQESKSKRWAKRSVELTTDLSVDSALPEEDLPDHLLLPYQADNIGKEPEVKVRTRWFIEGSRVPKSMISSEITWLQGFAESQGLEMGSIEEEEVTEINTHSVYYPDPCIATDHLESYDGLHHDVTDEWLIRWFEGTELIPNKTKEDTDGREWVSLKHGFTISLVRDWDDLCATSRADVPLSIPIYNEREAEIEVSVGWGLKHISLTLTTSADVRYLEDPIVKLICRRITNTWKTILPDGAEITADCEVLNGAERTQVCDPSYFMED